MIERIKLLALDSLGCALIHVTDNNAMPAVWLSIASCCALSGIFAVKSATPAGSPKPALSAA